MRVCVFAGSFLVGGDISVCVVRETVAKQAMDVYENRICTRLLRCVYVQHPSSSYL